MNRKERKLLKTEALKWMENPQDLLDNGISFRTEFVSDSNVSFYDRTILKMTKTADPDNFLVGESIEMHQLTPEDYRSWIEEVVQLYVPKQHTS